MFEPMEEAKQKKENLFQIAATIVSVGYKNAKPLKILLGLLKPN